MTEVQGDQQHTDAVDWGALRISPQRRALTVGGQPIQLTPTEWNVLLALLAQQGGILQPDDLLRQVWGDTFGAGRDYVHVYINRLRRKLERDPARPQLIVTDQAGYRLARAAATPAAATHEPREPLPAQLTSFVGRAGDVAALGTLLARPDVRLLNLTGPGGAGKTRLAIETVRSLAPRWPHGTFMVALAPLAEPDAVLPAIAQALGVVERRGRPIAERIARYLADQRCLLLLDNFEHVLAAAPGLVELLARAPDVTMLVTSRARLQVRGEQTYEVGPLALPPADNAETHSVDALTDNPAVALFAARAAAVSSGFALSAANAGTIAEICRRVDGLPLAIELAAARTTVLEPETLLERLTQRLTVLRGGAHDLPPHQQTLRGTIDWSFALLERGTQQRLAQLGVFAGGCTIEALEALSDGSSAATAGLLDDLTTLVDHHLVQRVAGASGSRFTLLETIREYALEQLAGSPGAAETQARHAAYFRDLALRASPHLQSPEQIVWLQRLDDEHENMRAALAWFIEQRRPEDAIAICGAIDVYWLLRGMAAESRRWLSAALAQATAPTPERASGLLSLGLAHAANGEPAAALTAFDAALALFERHEDEEGIAAVLNHSGAALLAVGERAAGLERLEQSRAIYQAQGFVLGVGCVQSKISVALMRGDELDRGLRMADEALELLAQAGDRLDTAGLNSGIGSALLADGQTERAIGHLQRSLQLYRELQAPDAIAALLCTLGRAELERAQPQRATELLLDALCQAQRIHNLDIPPLALVRLADAAAQTERYADAAQLLGAAAGALDDPAPGSRTPVHQEYMAVRERTQAVLPPAAWESAWGSGRSAGLTQTVRGLIGRG